MAIPQRAAAPGSADPDAPIAPIESRIRLVRGQRVLLDAELARLYGVSTGRLNEQVKRNRARFPATFRFGLQNMRLSL
jgi:hypothetical protein